MWDELLRDMTGTKLSHNFLIPLSTAHRSSQPRSSKYSSALQTQSPAATLANWGGPESGDMRLWLASARDLATSHRRKLIAWQEELDWQIYEAFGLVEPDDGVECARR
jgi:hypothetical protein